MAPQELTTYIVEQLKTGLRFGDIKKPLLELGWDEKSIDEAYQEANASLPLRTTQEQEYVLEGFSPMSPMERVVKRLIVVGIGVGAIALIVYVFMR